MALPTDITGLIRRWRADTIALANAAPVPSWSALTGGIALTQGTGANQPSYRTAVVNGQPVVRFDGSTDYLTSASVLTTQTQPFSVSVVLKWNALPGNSQQILDFSDNVSLYASSTPRWVGNSGTGLSGGSVSTTGFHAVTWTANGTSSEIYVDGSLVASGSSGTNAIPAAVLTIGRLASGNSRYASMDVAEIVAYSHGLTATERQTLGMYYTTQYAIVSADAPVNYTPSAAETATTSDSLLGSMGQTRAAAEVSTAPSALTILWGRPIGPETGTSTDALGSVVKNTQRFPLEVSESSDSVQTSFTRPDIDDYQFVLVDDAVNYMDPWVPFGEGQAISGKFDPSGFDVVNQDNQGILGDYRLFGTDRHAPPSWSWSLFTDVQTPQDALDWAAIMKRAWDHPVRQSPESVLALRYKVGGRIRRVYGRPRRFTPVPDQIQRGKIHIEADFALAEDVYYDDDEHAVTVGVIGASASTSAGIILPQPLPWIFTTASPPRTAQAILDGDHDTWMDIDFYGPAANPWVKIGNLTWALNGSLSYGQKVTVSGKPWSMGVRRNDGAYLPGMLDPRSRLSALQLPPGYYSVQYGGWDVSGSSYAVVRWRNAHGSF